MNGQYKTEQEQFWAGEFGNEYVHRNNNPKIIASNTALFSRIFSRTTGVKSVIELGANIGLNLRAIRRLVPDIQLSAIEINESALRELVALENIKVYRGSILDFKVDTTCDLALIKTVLIHIAPECLPDVYDLLYRASHKYICLAEYYNPSPVEVVYRGHSGKLFKRDFAGEMLKKYPELSLVDYGFVYHGDKNFAQDDITWFLLEKKKS